MKKKSRSITQTQKFTILHRDDFACRYCGDKPGAKNLEVDHLIPKSMKGSDNPENLVSACQKCNRSRSNQTILPKTAIERTDDKGRQVLKSWGAWAIIAEPGLIIVAGSVYPNNEYAFEIDRVHEMDWEDHIERKGWPEPHKFSDFCNCIRYARLLVQAPV